MPLQLPAVPNFTVQTPDVVGGMARAATLSQLLDENKLRQQLAPLQVQEQQQKAQQAGIQTQQMQLEQQSAQAMIKAWSDPDFTKKITGDGTNADASGLGFDPDAMTRELISRGVIPKDAFGMTQEFVKRSQTIAETQKAIAQTGEANAAQRTKGMKVLADKIGSILDLPIAKAGTALDALKQDLVKNPKAYAGVPQEDLAHVYAADLEHLPAMANLIGLESEIADFHKSKAEAAGAEATTTQKARGAAAPTASQLNNAVATLSTYAAIPQNMRVGLVNEMKAAPDWETLQKVQARADAANESFQRSADAREQTMAMKDVSLQNLVAGKLVAEDEKLGGTLDNSKGIRDLLTQNLAGNQTALAAAQVRFAGHEIKEGGINRITQTEINSQTKGVGDFARQLQTWADKGFQGKAPVAGVQEMRAILDMEDKAAIDTHQRNVDTITNRYLGKNTGAGGTTPQLRQLPQGAGKVIDKATAMKFYTAAGSDPDKARRLALQNGWKIQ